MNTRVRITFHHMPHTEALETYARESLSKLLERTPSALTADLHLHAEGAHAPHHHVELTLKSGAAAPHMSRAEGGDMYSCIDAAITKMRTIVEKERSKENDRHHKVKTEKQLFTA